MAATHKMLRTDGYGRFEASVRRSRRARVVKGGVAARASAITDGSGGDHGRLTDRMVRAVRGGNTWITDG